VPRLLGFLFGRLGRRYPRLTRDNRRWEERGSVELKGKAEPVRLYAPGLPGGTAPRAAGAAVSAD